MKKYKIILALTALFFGSNLYAVSDDRVEIDTITTNTPYGSCYRISKDTTNDVTFDQCATIIYNQYGEFWNNFYYVGLPSAIGDEVPFYGTLISQNNTAFIGRFTYQYDVEGSFTECTDEDYPYDGGDGYCYKNADFEDSFTVDQDAIDEYQAKLEEYQNGLASNYAEICTGDDCDMLSVLELLALEQEVDDQVDEYAQQLADSSEITTLSEYVDDLAETYTDYATLSDNADSINELEDETATLLDSTYTEAAETVDWWNTINSADSTYEEYSEAWEEREEYYSNVLDAMETATTQDDYDTAQAALETYDSDFDDAQDDYADLITSQTTGSTIIESNSSTITTNGDTITENLTTVTTISNTSTTTVNNGETCVGDTCVSTPDSTDTETDFTLENTESDYESFDDVLTGFYDSLEDAPIVQAFDSFADIIEVPSGSCPSFSMDLSSTIIGSTISTTFFCDLWDDFSSIITPCMYVVWLFGGFRILAEA